MMRESGPMPHLDVGETSCNERTEHASESPGQSGSSSCHPLRVVVIIDSLRTGGAERLVAEEAAAFDPARVALHVVVLARNTHTAFAAQVEARGVPISWVTGHGLLDVSRLGRLVRVLRALKPDVVHVHTDYATIIGLVAARVCGLPAVATMHGMTSYQTRWNTAKRLLEIVALRLGANRIVVVASSAIPGMRAQFKLPAQRIVTVPNAVGAAYFQPPSGFDRAAKRRELGVADDEVLVATIGRLAPVKGHAVLLEAVATLKERCPRARYAIVGGGPERPGLEEQVRRLGLDAQVQILGERQDVLQLLLASDLFVLPSLSEALPQALLEAMAAGVPCVATDVGGVSDVLVPGQAGWLVPPGNAAALAAALGDALGDPVRAAEYGAAGRARVKASFAMEARLNRLEALYREVQRRA